MFTIFRKYKNIWGVKLAENMHKVEEESENKTKKLVNILRKNLMNALLLYIE